MDFIEAVSRADGTNLVLDTADIIGEPLYLWTEDPDGQVRWVRGGRGQNIVASNTTNLVDSLAPRGREVLYRLGLDVTPTSPTLLHTLPGTGSHQIADSQGRYPVSFEWVDGAAGEMAVRSGRVDVARRPDPVLQVQPAGAPASSLVARTSLPDTYRLRDLLATGEPVLVIHDHSLCQIPGCDIPGVQVVGVTSIQWERTGHVDRVRRDWSLGFVQVADPHADTLTSLSTVDEFDAYWAGSTVDAHDAEWAGRTVDEYDSVDWGAAQ